MLRDAFFADELTPVETLADLTHMGMTYLHADLTLEGKDQLSMPLIG
jgi:hypothetical protein